MCGDDIGEVDTLKILQTGKRVYLRHPAPNDAEEFLAMVRSSRRLHRPWVYPPSTEEAFESYVKRSSSERHVGCLICLRQSDEIAGVASLSEIVRGVFQSAYLGFYGNAQHTGQGLMKEGVQLLLRHAFREMKLHRVEANVQPKSVRSRALVRSLGFRKEGFSPPPLSQDRRPVARPREMDAARGELEKPGNEAGRLLLAYASS